MNHPSNWPGYRPNSIGNMNSRTPNLRSFMPPPGEARFQINQENRFSIPPFNSNMMPPPPWLPPFPTFNFSMGTNPNMRPPFSTMTQYPSHPPREPVLNSNRMAANSQNLSFSVVANSSMSMSDFSKPSLPLNPLVNEASTTGTSLPVSKTSDEIIVEQFLLKIGKTDGSRFPGKKDTVSSSYSSTKFLKICEAKKLHCKAKMLVEKLEKCSGNSAINNMHVKECKDELERILLLLSDKDIIRDLKKKLAARKKKRNRLKRMKQENYGVKMLRKQRIEEANKELVEWKKQQITILEEQKREKELQTQLDEALLDMRRELNTITKSLDMINSLAALRKTRYNSMKAKGQELPSSTVTDQFNERVKQTKTTLLSYKESCIKKIDSLKMFLEAEHEEAKREIANKKAKQRMEMQRKRKEERNLILFGNQHELDPFDTMWPVQEVHKQAEKSLAGLVQYRRLWDQYLHPDGSAIPVGWVEPVLPSSDQWEKFFVSAQREKKR